MSGDLRRLSLIGYWTDLSALPERSRGWPDPRDLTGGWSADDRRAALAHLRRGRVFRFFAGTASCRICAEHLGSHEATDGVWAWPVGLDHYVEIHDIRLPEAFMGAARISDWTVPSWLATLEPQPWIQIGESSMPLTPGVARDWIVEDGEWLDWAAASTPARPVRNAASLAEAQQLCRRLSHSDWRCSVDETRGRWALQVEYGTQATRIYVQKCPVALLERRILSLRAPDPSRILDFDGAEAIAAEYDGAWGGARMVAANPEACLVWVRPFGGRWPTDAEIMECAEKAQGFGWTVFHPDGGKSLVVPPVDEIAWRWLLTRQREEAEEHMTSRRGVLERCRAALRRIVRRA
jgi:hypothetical protein